MGTMLWTASLDDRYGAGQVTSRIGLIAEAHKFDPDSDLWAAVNAENAQRPLACVLVDEAQFLSRGQVLDLARLADEANIPRSEEHTSELQSLMRISYAVFFLKKKTNIEH